ncbi:MAG: glycoside hydrolase family 66 protein [Jatrophihabitantaceae bacterium]
MSGQAELLPTRTSYRPDEPVGIEVRGLTEPALLTVWHLGEPVGQVAVAAAGVIELGVLPAGGYSVELDGHAAQTAVEVVADARSVLRYGFVVDYRPGRELAAVRDNLRRLHLTGVQFYDWAYRHADLLGGGEQYADALGQPVSLATVRALVETCHQVGSDALGYAAVYAVGPAEWPKWEHDALLTATGVPYALGDFLFILDPAATDWLDHFTAELIAATERVGFDGYHLDQYGYPKQAHRPDGQRVDVAESFGTLIAGVRQALPDDRLVFNNVNDFPTWRTGPAAQDAVYIEVWKPQLGLGHLAQTVTRARAVAAGKPVVIAAYQHVYDSASVAQSDLATAFTMAALFSHGASHLLCGEADRILVDPYYVRNHQAEPSTADLLHRYYDFSVAHAELLFDPGIVEVTSSFAADYNDDVDVSYAGVAVEQLATAGTVWRRISQLPDGRYVVHLINLTGQDDIHWDAPRNQPAATGPGALRIRRMGSTLPRLRYASPDSAGRPTGRLVELELTADGDYAVGTLPEVHIWQLLLIEPFPPSH